MKPTKTYFTKVYGNVVDIVTTNEIFVYLLAAFLVTIPLGYAFGSIIGSLFTLVALLSVRRNGFRLRPSLALPMLMYTVMLLSMLWTRDKALSMSGLRKEMFFFVLPFAFCFIPDFTKTQSRQVLKLYSWGMVVLGIGYLINAAWRFFQTGDTGVFFYHELVTIDVNAIYVSVFMSAAFFYFFAIRDRAPIEQAALGVLAVLIVLLSSKSIIFIDFILVCCFYLYFAKVRDSVKWLTIVSAIAFLAGSVMFIPKIRDRFLIEYETAFVDNTVNNSIGDGNGKVYNVSLNQAWNNKTFAPNQYFPGTAMRIYQGRIFSEMMNRDKKWLTGYGLEASQEKIREKARQYQLYEGYGDYNFHNQYIQTFAELGVFGFLILATMVVLNLRKAFSTKNFPHIVFAVTMLVLFLSESFFCRQRGIIFFVALYCFFNAVKPAAPEEAK